MPRLAVAVRWNGHAAWRVGRMALLARGRNFWSWADRAAVPRPIDLGGTEGRVQSASLAAGQNDPPTRAYAQVS